MRKIKKPFVGNSVVKVMRIELLARLRVKSPRPSKGIETLGHFNKLGG